MTNKEIENVLHLDCRSEECQQIIQKKLRQIKPLAKYTDCLVPLEMLERCLRVLSNKYGMMINSIYWSQQTGVWRSEVVTTKKFRRLGTAYGCTLYECAAKTVLLMYYKRGTKG